ncbi:MAG: hypothetical protein H0W87_10050, partial [Actinobacteria bacterium]|nr:hypothetical protein [Actinomycetota bacterium]
KSVAVDAPTRGWPLEKKDPIAVPHYVGKRIVGTILGFYALTRSPESDHAGFEAALAFPVAPKAFAVVHFELADPITDSAGEWGDYLVGGLDLPSVWNRGQAFWAMSNVRVVGNLPPTRIELSASGRTLLGSVSDAFYHPVLGLPVSIQHRIGTSWRVIGSAKTDAHGNFSLPVAARGDYRAAAASRGRSAVSRAVYVG